MGIIKPSTRNFFAEARKTPGYSLFDFLHGYIYGRWVHLYIAIGTGRHNAVFTQGGRARPRSPH